MEEKLTTEQERELAEKAEEQSLSTRLKALLEKPDLLEKMVKEKPAWMSALDDETPSSAIAANLIAEGLKGDKKAIELIQKIAYGDRVVIDTAPGFFDTKDITITIVDPKHKADGQVQPQEDVI